MRQIGSLLNFIGGSVTRVAGAGIAAGAFITIAGLSPGEFVARLIAGPPNWLNNPWLSPALVIFGVVVIWASLHFNRWSLRQKAIDALAEELSWAIHHLLNKRPKSDEVGGVDGWEADFHTWCNRVSGLLSNRAYFTRADQLHFDRLGFVEPVRMSGQSRLDWLLAMLKLKFERLREVINWQQQRSR